MSKLLWVVLPLLVYAAYVGWRILRGRAPGRHAWNVNSSVLLLVYFGLTASLGLFWVARQQLPVFDWHYLFGYVTLLLLALHLGFNLRVVWRYVRRFGRPRKRVAASAKRLGGSSQPVDMAVDGGEAAKSAASLRLLAFAVVLVVSVAGAFVLGMRHARRSSPWSPAAAARDTVRREMASDSGGPPGLAARLGGARGPVEVIERYHEASSLSRLGVLSRGPDVNWGQSPPAFKRHAGKKSTPLPLPGGFEPRERSLSEALLTPVAAALEGGDVLDLEQLSSLVYHAVGITDDSRSIKLRAAPSAGGLFGTELYVAARQVVDLEPGLYHCDPQRHALGQLRPQAPSAADFGVPGAALFGRGPVDLVLTGIVRRIGHKYGDRAFRYLVEDAGHVLENLRIAAHEIGLSLDVLERFDDQRVAESLSVDGIEEVVLAVAALVPPRIGSAEAERRTSSTGATRWGYRDGTKLPAQGELGASGWAHQATSLELTVSSSSRAAGPGSAATAAGLFVLPEPVAAPRSALDTIASRRSERRYAAEPVGLEPLSSLLHDAAAPPATLSTAVRYRLVATRVEGLTAGIYRYQPGQHALELVRSGDLSDEAQAAGLSQAVMGDAAAIVALSIDRGLALGGDGARGYRHALLEVGMVGERLQLGAVARGLRACPVGAFYDDDAAKLLAIDPEREWVTHFVTLGRTPK